MISKRLYFLILFVLLINFASASYGFTTHPDAFIKVDFDHAADVNTQQTWTGFVLADSGSEVNDVDGNPSGVIIDIGGSAGSARRVDPNSNNNLIEGGVGIAREEMYRDFIYGLSDNPLKITLWGLGAKRKVKIYIYAYDDESESRRVANWTANGDYLLTTDFTGGNSDTWPIDPNDPWYQFGFYPDAAWYDFNEIAYADDLGSIYLTCTEDAENEDAPFAFANGLVVVTYGTPNDVPYAQHPLPLDGGEEVPVDANLEWKAGDYADTHDVYFSMDFNDVNDANKSNPLDVLVSEDQSTTTYDPPGSLELSTTYYWRVDEVNDANIWKGKVWSFTTHVPVVIATNPAPVDGAQKTLRKLTLSWEEGEDAEKHDVYLGTDFNDVNDANRSNPLGVLVSQGQITATYSPDLDFNTTYYWRIDEVNSAGYDAIFKGDVWSFTTYEPTTTWRVDERCFENGHLISVKDPSIVYAGGKWHMFYTYVGDGCQWCLGYASATTIAGLNDAGHTSIQDIVPGFAPQIFWYEPQSIWYLTVSGAKFSTNTDINDINGWTAPQSMGSFSGLDTSCISDGNNMYFFSASDDGDVLRRSTTVEDFPYGWSEPTIVATDTFEGVQVYKSLADGKSYMLIEDFAGEGRYYELWTADSPGGTWTKVEEEWAHGNKLVYFADHWTDQVSHGELLRAGKNERFEISDINRCQFLIQGVLAEDYESLPYGSIPYEIGIIRQSIGAMGDLDYDYDVDSLDYAILASQWLQPQTPYVPSADIAQPGGDGIVDMHDLALLVDNWLWGK